MINGQFVDASHGETFDVLNPADGSLITKVSAANEDDVNKAVESCTDAAKIWKGVPPFVKSSLMNKYADKIEENLDELATLESEDVGKIRENAIGDMMFSAMIVRYYAGLANNIHGKSYARDSYGIANN